MRARILRRMALMCGLLLLRVPFSAASIAIEGAPGDSGYNAGSVATIRAAVKNLPGEPSGYAVFADIQYVGTTSVSSVQLDRLEEQGDTIRYEGGWRIPPDAPTGIYAVAVKVEERSSGRTIARQKIHGFGVYRKLVRIAGLRLDKTFYTVGEPIHCEVVLENLTNQDLQGLRVEFSNANYPWISSLRVEAGTRNPDLAIRVLRKDLDIPARSRVVIPMMPAGIAAFLQGAQRVVLGVGGPQRQEKLPPPEVDQYTVAVWNRDRTYLYDMQFTAPAIVRAADRDLPKPYGLNFTHPYLSQIDFTKYRQFYPPEWISPAIGVDRSRTMFRVGEPLIIRAALKNPETSMWSGVEFGAQLLDAAGKELYAKTLHPPFDLAPGEARNVEAKWSPGLLAPGVYTLRLSLAGPDGKPLAGVDSEIAVNVLPASILFFLAHEDDETAYPGLIRAAVEAGIPVRVVIGTGGDVGGCERYYSKPCGPNEAREFALVRMEETMVALEHLGLPRDRVTFLGLPDGGSGAIWSQHIKASNPFLSVYLATDRAPYDNVLKPNLPFAREPVIELAKQIISEFKPAMIATTHPDERHVDHRIASWFALKACHELLREKQIDPGTVVLADVAYGAGGAKAAPFKYEPTKIYLSGETAGLAQEMTWLYQSQDGNLAEGMRKPLAELPREEIHLRILDWQEHEGWNE